MKLITYVIQHLLAQEAQGILVVPFWPSGLFWSRLTKDGVHLISMFYKFHIFRPTLHKGEFCDFNVFDASANFEMIGLIFNSSRPKNVGFSPAVCLKGGCEVCKK